MIRNTSILLICLGLVACGEEEDFIMKPTVARNNLAPVESTNTSNAPTPAYQTGAVPTTTNLGENYLPPASPPSTTTSLANIGSGLFSNIGSGSNSGSGIGSGKIFDGSGIGNGGGLFSNIGNGGGLFSNIGKGGGLFSNIGNGGGIFGGGCGC